MSDKDKYISELEDEIKKLRHKVDNLTEFLVLAQKQKFGSSSEKTVKIKLEEQLNLFNEAEAEIAAANELSPEPIAKTDKGYTKRDPKTNRARLIKDLPVQPVDCDLPDDQRVCAKCGNTLVPIGKEFVREEIEYIPAQVKIKRYFRTNYGFPNCKKHGDYFIKKAFTPISLLNHSLASASSVASVMYQKYVNALPLYRQEKDWEQMGYELSRATMANWVIRCSESWLAPIVDCLHQELLTQEVIHCDETPVRVLKEDGKKAQSKSYMWVYRSGKDEENLL